MTEGTESWFGDHGEVVGLARALVAADWLTSGNEVVDYIEKPWKWDTCREAWITSGRPTTEDPEWEMFTARLTRLE